MQLLKAILRRLISEIAGGFYQFGACLCPGAEVHDDAKEGV
jgi:hypothetical protein